MKGICIIFFNDIYWINFVVKWFRYFMFFFIMDEFMNKNIWEWLVFCKFKRLENYVWYLEEDDIVFSY